MTTDARPESLGWQEKNLPAGGYSSCWRLLFLLAATLPAGGYSSCWRLLFLLAATLSDIAISAGGRQHDAAGWIEAV